MRKSVLSLSFCLLVVWLFAATEVRAAQVSSRMASDIYSGVNLQKRSTELVVDDERLMDVARSFFDFSSEDSAEANELTKRWSHRKKCSSDHSCPSNSYCSTKRHKCFRKLKHLHKCSRDGACRSGYCGRRTHKCASKKSNGRKCFQTGSACASGYCNSKANRCASKGKQGDSCSEDAGCWSGKCSANGQCKSSSHPHPQPPINSPSPHPHPHPHPYA